MKLRVPKRRKARQAKAETRALNWDWNPPAAEQVAYQSAPTYLEALKASGRRPATPEEFDALFGDLPVDRDN